MNQRSILITLGLAAVLTLLPAFGADAQTVFQSNLFGQAEIPPVQTDDYGTCTGVLDENETVLTLSCEHTVADPTASHIHAGFGNENGPVVQDLGNPASPIQIQWLLDDEEVVRLLAGGLYVNVHTAAHPAGHVRGQLKPSQPLAGETLSVALTGDAVVPAVTTAASGACYIGVEPVETKFVPIQEINLDIRCTHDADDVTGAELVLGGAEGEEGTVIIDLGDGTAPIEAELTLDDSDQVQDFLEGEAYIQILSDDNPDGELRGQLDSCLTGPNSLCLNDDRFRVTVNFNTGSESGQGVAVRETDDSGMFWFFRPSNLEVLIKVLDGCGVNGHFWVFSSATTNVGYEIEVTDTQEDVTVTYVNENLTPAVPILDTAAFETCP